MHSLPGLLPTLLSCPSLTSCLAQPVSRSDKGYFLPVVRRELCCDGERDYSLLAAGVPRYYSWPGSGARPTPPHTQFCSRTDRSRPSKYILPGYHISRLVGLDISLPGYLSKGNRRIVSFLQQNRRGGFAILIITTPLSWLFQSPFTLQLFSLREFGEIGSCSALLAGLFTRDKMDNWFGIPTIQFNPQNLCKQKIPRKRS